MTPQCYFVYGNHGENPVQLEDYLDYFWQVFQECGITLRYSPHVVPGELNIVQDAFRISFVDSLKEIKSQHPSTRLICLATEFVTGGSFNHFSPPSDSGKLAFNFSPQLFFYKKMLPVLFPSKLRNLAKRLAPNLYDRLKTRGYYGVVGAPNPENLPKMAEPTIYEDRHLWDLRYKNFRMAADLCEQIWCISPDQMEGYQGILGNKVRWVPLLCLDPNPQIKHHLEKDIDVLFTGTLTSYRRKIIEELKSQGLRVWVGPIIWSAVFRNNFLARTKICLQIRQYQDWPYPSLMRLHHLLIHGCNVIGERTTRSCFQEEFIQVTDPAEFIPTCLDALKRTDWEERGKEQLQKYYQRSMEFKQDLISMIREAIGF